MQKIALNKVMETILTVCQGTLDGMEKFEDQLTLVMKVLAFVMFKGELEIEEPTGARGLGERLLAADVFSRLKHDD